MNLRVTLSTRRQSAIEIFNRLRRQALLRRFTSALLGNGAALDDFAALQPCLNPNRRYAGFQDIPVSQINGSVGRSKDFDRSFRPLKKHLFERWVANYLFLQGGSWPLIRVYKVGSQYFVEDGHHRVSVARSTGMAYIQAEVWEYELVKAPSAAPVLVGPVIEKAVRVQAPCGCEAVPFGQ